MSSRFKILTVLSPLVLLLLAAVPASVYAGAKIGNAYVVSDAPEEEVFPSVAYNSTRQEYLVVWFNDRAGNDDIRAQRLTRDGFKIGSAFYISAGAGHDRRYPDVAYNSQHDQYLVVWENEDAIGFFSIRARRVSGTGAVMDSTDIVLAGGSNLSTTVAPAVAYASTSDRYMVVWAETWHPMPITYTIYAQDVDETGAKVTSATTVVQSSTFVRDPDIAYNRHANRHLVVWSEYNSGTTYYQIMGQQVHGGGGTFSTVISIDTHPRDYIHPAVASIPTASGNVKFLVVYEFQDTTADHDIYGKFIKEDGTVVNSTYLIAITLKDETSPAVAGNELSQEYFIIWRENLGVMDKPIKGIQISSQGDAWGDVIEFSGPAMDNPAIAAGHMADFLLVWQDQPVVSTNMNIYAQLYGNREFVPLFMKSP
jgi:hypothetical protein